MNRSVATDLCLCQCCSDPAQIQLNPREFLVPWAQGGMAAPCPDAAAAPQGLPHPGWAGHQALIKFLLALQLTGITKVAAAEFFFILVCCTGQLFCCYWQTQSLGFVFCPVISWCCPSCSQTLWLKVFPFDMINGWWEWSLLRTQSSISNIFVALLVGLAGIN